MVFKASLLSSLKRDFQISYTSSGNGVGPVGMRSDPYCDLAKLIQFKLNELSLSLGTLMRIQFCISGLKPEDKPMAV